MFGAVGTVKGVKRTEARGKIANFAFVEMDTVDDVIRCQKMLKDYNLLNHELKVTISKET